VAKVKSVNNIANDKISFDEIKEWHSEHMHPSKMDLEDPEVYKVYEEAKFAGIFQVTGKGAQRLFVKAKPENIIDIATLTSIYRPGPLAADVDKLYIDAKNNNKQMDWGDDRINKILEKTYSCLTGDSRVMTDNGEVTIKEIVDKQMVGITLPSYNEESAKIESDVVVAAVSNGVRDVIEIELEDGKRLTVTEDHLVMTKNRGWVNAGALTDSDEVLIFSDCENQT
jgi:hypothetical protein